jgi:hypothetical protein
MPDAVILANSSPVNSTYQYMRLVFVTCRLTILTMRPPS